ncbi:hypothetical protein EDD52_10811 [Primorskyibacter sedentarius]|uniref:Transposase n=1 Tax=Primorskyibacter sedentarius TaxID=745311 RepID=A0A4R3JAV8_9RHOB|nr:hypothetical protein [Primorskyibacter sedentarius]TCS62717.1 hypothetical protein EDD52_10811 [Primorskyibacter sedentarius]
MQNVIGIDVSKATLDAYCSGRTEHRRFGDDAAGLAALFLWVFDDGRRGGSRQQPGA